jgi:Uma2 family endonuclease
MSVKLSPASSSPSASRLGPFRLADYDRLPRQPRHELLFGNLIVAPSPTVRHQVIALFLWRHLQRSTKNTRGWVCAAPADVILAEHSVVQPDIYYVAADRKDMPLDGRMKGAPDLIVEVLSPGTAVRDRHVKLNLYAQAGVREYWLVDPQTRAFDFLLNDGGCFRSVLPQADEYRSTVAGIHIDVRRFWQELDAELA